MRADMMASLEFGTPAPPHGRRKKASPDSPDASEDITIADTPTLLLRRVASTPSSPTSSFIGSSRKRAAVGIFGAFALVVVISVGALTVRSTPVATARQLTETPSRGVVPSPIDTAAAEVSRLDRKVSAVEAVLTELQTRAAQQANDTAALRQQVSALRAAKLSVPSPGATSSPSSPFPAATASAPAPKSSAVHVWFVFDVHPKLPYPSLELYWLSGNSSERWYATIPAGQRVDERTFPGQCWRARTPKENGGQHVSSYCATSAAEQVVRLQPQEKVNLDFHYPAAAAVVDRVHEPTKPTSSLFNRSAVTKPLPKLNKASVFIVSAATSSGASDSHSPAVHAAAVAATEIETLVGHVAAGDHLVTSAAAGAVYRVRDSRTRQPLLPRFVAGSEAEQHVDITASQSVILEFTLGPATAAGDGAALYWTWGDARSFAREHLHTELRMGASPTTVRVTSPPGEGPYREEQMLLEVAAAEAPAVQRHVIVVPPRA